MCASLFGERMLFVRFQELMNSLHKKLHVLYAQDHPNPVKQLALDLNQQHNLICIDELEVRDIADAMLIRGLVPHLNPCVFTSNAAPHELYAGGIQRESFLTFIRYLQDQFIVFDITGPIDYRSLLSANSQLLFCHGKEDQFQQLYKRLTEGRPWQPKEINSFGRKITLAQTHDTLLLTSFDELCRSPFSYNDYIELAKHFRVIVFQDPIPAILPQEGDISVRFINLIDSLYANQVELVAQVACDNFQQIYQSGPHSQQFLRTASRLNQMSYKT